MANKQNFEDLKGFTDAIVNPDGLVNPDGISDVDKDDDDPDLEIVNPSDMKDLDDKKDDQDDDDDQKDDDQKDDKDDDQEDDDDKDDKKDKEDKDDDDDQKNNDDSDDDEIVDLGEAEPEMAKYVQEKLYDKLGISLTEDNAADSIESIVDELEKIVEEASAPAFASKEVAELNNFIENGGSAREYLESRYIGDFDIEKIDLEKPIDQEKVVREFLRSQEIPEDRIDKRIQRYEEKEVLEEEAEDAFDLLKKYKEKTTKKLLEQQQNFVEESQKQQLKFYDDVTEHIRSLEEINGITVSKKQREQLIKDIFIPDKDGRTKYQKEYENSLVSNLTKSAFYTLLGDKHTERIKRKAKSDTVKDLKNKMDSFKKGPKIKNTVETQKKSSEDALKQATDFLMS